MGPQGHYKIKNPGAGQQVTKYYSAGASRVAMRKYTIPVSMAVEYFLSDHLGLRPAGRRSPTEPCLRPQVSSSPQYNFPMERYRIVEGVGLYYITFSVIEWLPVFVEETACKVITDSLNFCITNKHLGVNAYVIMPTHLHAITFDTEFNSERLKHTLDDMRKFTGRQLLDHAARHLPKSFSEQFRGHAGKDRERRFWQPTQHPVGIYSYEFWKQKLDYVHHNPCRKGLVRNPEDWRFSSARFWLTGEKDDVQLSDVGWE